MRDELITATAKRIADELKATIAPATGYGDLPDSQVPEQIFGERVYQAVEDSGSIDFAAQIIAFATGYSDTMMNCIIWDSVDDGETLEEAIVSTAAIAWEFDF